MEHALVHLPYIRTMTVRKRRRRADEVVHVLSSVATRIPVADASEAVPFMISTIDPPTRYESIHGVVLAGVPYVDIRHRSHSLAGMYPGAPTDPMPGDTDPFYGRGEETWSDPAWFDRYAPGGEGMRTVHDNETLRLFDEMFPELYGRWITIDVDDVDDHVSVLTDDREAMEARVVALASCLVFANGALCSSLIVPAVVDHPVWRNRTMVKGVHVDTWPPGGSSDCELVYMGLDVAASVPLYGVPEREGPWSYPDAEREINRVRDIFDAEHQTVSFGPCREEADAFDVLCDRCWERRLTALEVVEAMELLKVMKKSLEDSGRSVNPDRDLWMLERSIGLLETIAVSRRVIEAGLANEGPSIAP
jgi:hypothetical protein